MLRKQTRTQDSNRPPSLAELQRWFSEKLTGRHGGDLVDLSAWLTPAARYGRTPLSAGECVEIYRSAHKARVGIALKEDFPAVHRFLGDRGFIRAVRNLLAAHPSHSPNLADISAAFPKHLTAFWQLPFIKDLAALEWRIVRAFQAAHSPSDTLSALERLSGLDEDQWLSSRIGASPSLHLMRSEWDVLGAWHAARALPLESGAADLEVQEEPCFLAVYRLSQSATSEVHEDEGVVLGTDVRISRLSSWEYRLIKTLKAGKTLGESLSEGVRDLAPSDAAARSTRAEQAMERLRSWLTFGLLG